MATLPFTFLFIPIACRSVVFQFFFSAFLLLFFDRPYSLNLMSALLASWEIVAGTIPSIVRNRVYAAWPHCTGTLESLWLYRVGYAALSALINEIRERNII